VYNPENSASQLSCKNPAAQHLCQCQARAGTWICMWDLNCFLGLASLNKMSNTWRTICHDTWSILSHRFAFICCA